MTTRLKASLLSFVAAWALLVLPVVGRLARAQTGNPDIDRGIALYNDLEYEEAEVVLSKALSKPNLSVQEVTEGYKYLGLTYVALGRDDDARAAFRKLLETDPRYELPRTENPKAIDLFDEVKKSMPLPPGAVRMTQSASPSSPRRSQPVVVTIGVVDQDGRHSRVMVYHRVKGQRSYSAIKAQAGGAGRYAATISGTFIEPPAIEYYVVAEDAEGRALAQEGTPQEPLLLLVDRRTVETTPVYGHWWFWASIGGLLLAGTLVGVALSGDDATPPPGNTADVTITVDYTP